MIIKRHTIQRQLTLDTVQALMDHPTADEVYENIRLKYPDISKGTVYRNLKDLAETEQIRKISLPNEADKFDHISKPHYHMRCPKCGELVDINMEYMKELDEKIMQLTGLELEGHEIFFKGICLNCKN